MFYKLIISILLLLSLQVVAQIPVGYEKGIEFINKEDIQNTISVLAHDSLKGRSAGSYENFLACKFMAEKFSQFGLSPYIGIGIDKSKTPEISSDDENKPPLYAQPNEELLPFDKYFQKFYLLDSKINQHKTKLSTTVSSNQYRKKRDYVYHKDFLVDYGELQNISLTAEIVFLGYGIEKGEGGYSDYVDSNGKRIDVKDKIVMIVEGYPQESDTASAFNKVKNHIYKNTKRKATNAYENGALAVLVLKSPLKKLPPFVIHFDGYAKAFSKSDFSLPGMQRKESVPIVYIDDEIAVELFSGLNKSITKVLQEIDSTFSSNSFLLENKTISLDIEFEQNLIPTQNVVGYIEGSDPVLKDEYVVIGGHIDHVGLGYYGAMNKNDVGKIHNGADDNASGTAAVIELAEAFSKTKPKRSVIFIGFNAEENGLLGSRHYAYQNPFKPHEKTAAMLNLDMIGRNETDKLWIGGIFYGDDMKAIIEDANKETGFELFYNVGLLTFGSDQGPFIRMKVPSVFFFAGLHDDYHTPLDDIEKINYEKATNVTKLAFLTAWKVANGDKNPSYRELSMDEKVKLVNESLSRQKNKKQKHQK